jgi:phosphoglycolate phosphatase-like HAD superfamily hydrolase
MVTIKLLIFDIDLTISDNFARKKKAIERGIGRRLKEKSFQRIKRAYGLEAILKGLGFRESEIPLLQEKILNHFFYDEDLFDLDTPLEGAVETLKSLAKEGYKIYYLTGRPLIQTAEKFLNYYGFPAGPVFAEMIKPGESEKKIKLFAAIVKHAKINPREALAVGDLPGDAIAAKKVGIMTVGTCQAPESSEEELKRVCDYTISNIADLPKILQKIKSKK